MASYWTRKDDQSGELSTVKPWEEVLGHGDRTFPHMRYHVVCGVIEQNGRFLCMQKGQTKYVYTTGKWEFPGGKVELGESPERALHRELLEEMDYEVKVGDFLGEVTHTYPDFTISMQAFRCSAVSPEFQCKEHQSFRWCSLEEMDDLDWCEADKAIVGMLKSVCHV